MCKGVEQEAPYLQHHNLMETERKGFTMHDMAVLMIWCASNIAGVILTLCLPHIFPDAPGGEKVRDEVVHLAPYEGFEGERMSVLYGDKAA